MCRYPRRAPQFSVRSSATYRTDHRRQEQLTSDFARPVCTRYPGARTHLPYWYGSLGDGYSGPSADGSGVRWGRSSLGDGYSEP